MDNIEKQIIQKKQAFESKREYAEYLRMKKSLAQKIIVGIAS